MNLCLATDSFLNFYGETTFLITVSTESGMLRAEGGADGWNYYLYLC